MEAVACQMGSCLQHSSLVEVEACPPKPWRRGEKQSGNWNTTAEYKYDARNRRILKTVTNKGSLNGTTRFLWGGAGDWQCLEERDSSGDVVARFTYAPGYIDAVAVQERDLNADDDFGDSNEVVYYHSNTLFTVYALSDANESVIERYRYDAYGACTVLDADGSADADGISDVLNPYTFTGRRVDLESGLMQYRNGYYHTGLGRFISRDPAGYADSHALYAYSICRPTAGVDPSGNKWELTYAKAIDIVDREGLTPEEIDRMTEHFRLALMSQAGLSGEQLENALAQKRKEWKANWRLVGRHMVAGFWVNKETGQRQGGMWAEPLRVAAYDDRENPDLDWYKKDAGPEYKAAARRDAGPWPYSFFVEQPGDLAPGMKRARVAKWCYRYENWPLPWPFWPFVTNLSIYDHGTWNPEVPGSDRQQAGDSILLEVGRECPHFAMFSRLELYGCYAGQDKAFMERILDSCKRLACVKACTGVVAYNKLAGRICVGEWRYVCRDDIEGRTKTVVTPLLKSGS